MKARKAARGSAPISRVVCAGPIGSVATGGGIRGIGNEKPRGFTLFEVVISMLVLSIAVLTTLALLPIGLKSQQMARYQLFASSTAMSLLENFHSPLVSFKGHGRLAPETNRNLSANPDDPPVPGWANRLRDYNMTTGPYQHDIERYLCGWMTGVMPVPVQIARRLDSDGDEIQKHLDQGGCLFYVDSGYVRGLTVASDRDKSIALNPPPEVQKLVFAVTGYAQENALTSHPVESWPWYELYPFPPAWVALRASGYEIRRGPISKMKHVDPGTGTVTWGPPIYGQDMWGQGGGTHGNANAWDGGIIWGDGGHVGWQAVTFPPAPMNARQLSPPQSSNWPNPVTDQTINKIDAPDIAPNPADANAAGTAGWYQGRNWRYFKEKYGTGTPWDNGWQEFQKLAGFNDVHRDLTWTAYAALAEAEHFEKAGWLPVMAMLTNQDDPRYDAYWYELQPDPMAPGKFRYRGGQTIGGENDVGTGVFPPRPLGWTGSLDAAPWNTGDQYGMSTRTGAPHSMPLPPTYEMRASYRDKALELWNAVASDISSYKPVKVPIGGYTPVVTNTQEDCDVYEYGPQELEKFPLVDPHSLPAGECPPHPAQVLALSYLAHAAMLMTGWDVPFESRDVWQRLDWDCLAWQYRDAANALHTKDAKILAADVSRGSSTVQIVNDTPGKDMVFYQGDEICFEQDYRAWYRSAEPNPNPAPPQGCVKYRIRAATHISPGATGTVDIEPNLVHDYQSITGITGGNPWMNPPIPADTGHPQQIIRVCSEYDRTFARKVHEMCMRWASSYAAENPYDWGAPRMMNHQVMNDKPLAIFDLFHDAGQGPTSPSNLAIRTPKNLPTVTTVSPTESFYRWLMPPNQAPRTWFKQNFTPATGPVSALSHHGPARANTTPWYNLMYNPELAPASTAAPTTTSEWNWTSDKDRYWLNRPYAPFHRCRQLVFWAVEWKSYVDAETAPSAPLDLAKHARSIHLKADGTTVDTFWPMLAAGDGWGNSNRQDSQMAGNPENGILWLDSERKKRYLDAQTNPYLKSFWTYTRESEDIVLGHWGADRNNNRILDEGPIPKTTRLRALQVAHFNVYDPVLRLHNSD